MYVYYIYNYIDIYTIFFYDDDDDDDDISTLQRYFYRHIKICIYIYIHIAYSSPIQGLMFSILLHQFLAKIPKFHTCPGPDMSESPNMVSLLQWRCYVN